MKSNYVHLQDEELRKDYDGKIRENIAEIGLGFGFAIAKGVPIRGKFATSVELREHIIDLAERFEEEYGEVVEENQNYIECIDQFIEKAIEKIC